MKFHIVSCGIGCAVLLGVALHTPSAQAFTVDGHSYTNSDGTSRFQDPDDALQKGSDGSGFSMKFSGGGGGSQDNADRLFLPSTGNAVGSPFQSRSGFDSVFGNRYR